MTGMREGAGRLPAARWRPAAAARRIGAAPRALTLAGTALAAAALAQAIAAAAALAGAPGHAGLHAVVPDALLLGLVALATTVPLVVLRPVAAAVLITTASVLALAAFGVVLAGGAVTPGLMTAGGAAAEVLAVYRLGIADAGRPGGGPARWRASAPFLAPALAAPFLVLALLSRGGAAAVLLASLVPAAAGAGVATRAWRSASQDGAARSELADALVEHMARGERARIARELHDVVAHHISVISVQAETARLTVPGLPADGARRLLEIGETARAGLTEMRRLLGVLRPDADPADSGDRQPQPGLRQLTSLIDGSRPASGGGVRLIVSGPVRSFDPGVELVAYRIAQEALTNARRHAPGAAVDVELRYEPDLLRMRIRDNGPGPAPAGPQPARDAAAGRGGSAAGRGHGLLGMRERAATVRGTLRTGAAPGGGFLVEADLPAMPEAGA
jgi:signal transduction histidine kinase